LAAQPACTATAATLRNTIFERCFVVLEDLWGASNPTRNSEEHLQAVNNLLYGCDMWFAPVSGANWTFTDNI
jgi:hypothetical protein